MMILVTSYSDLIPPVTFAAKTAKMIVSNLCEPAPKQELIDRINRLSPDSKAQWGKMNVSQMLAHLQMPMGVALGDHKLKANFLMRLIGSSMKSKLYDEKPYKKGLPTAPTFKMTTEKDFELERVGQSK